MASLTAKEDTYWRDRGYIAVNAECNCPMRKEDLFGFIDRVYLGEDGQVVYVQITRTDHMAARVEKILEGSTGHGQWRVRHAEIARRLLKRAPCVKILVVGWQKNERTWKFERTQQELELWDMNAALGLS
jgi:hypothetical protein